MEVYNTTTAMLHGQTTLQHLLFNYRQATWTAYNSTFNLHITAMLHGQPTLQHLFSTLPPSYIDSLQFNFHPPDYLHATWTAYTTRFTLPLQPC
jgi:hypothetical protein